MTVQLNSEQERVVGLAIQAGLIRDADDVLEIGMAEVRKQLRTRHASPARITAGEWSRTFDAWMQSHTAAGPLLSDQAIDRDSIYGEREL